MSTILDALKKVERERQPARGPLLDITTALEPKPRRRFPVGLIAACATVGFTVGIALALWRNTAPLEVAETSPPVDEPAARDLALAARDAAGGAAALPGERGPRAPAVPAAEQRAIDGGDAGRRVPPTVAETEPSERPAPRAPVDLTVAIAKQPAMAPEPAPKTHADGAKLPDRAAEGSALEPSPFAARKEPADVAPPVQTAPAAPVAPAIGAAEAIDDEELAAIAPSPDEVLDEEEEPAATPPPKETVVDTGRSPTGQPKVSLSFLQWSEDPARRFAFISVEGGPSQRVREGDTTGGLTVAAITPTGVRFRHDTTIFTIAPRH